MQPTYHVIVADDDTAIRSLVARVIGRSYPQATISTAAHGLEALSAYQERGADLVITDEEMPLLSGLGLVEKLRRHSLTLPIIMLTAHAHIEGRARALGVTRFLLKPFSVTQFVQSVSSILPP